MLVVTVCYPEKPARVWLTDSITQEGDYLVLLSKDKDVKVVIPMKNTASIVVESKGQRCSA